MSTLNRREASQVFIPVNTGSIYANTDTVGGLATWVRTIPETIIQSNMAYSGTAGSYGILVYTHPR